MNIKKIILTGFVLLISIICISLMVKYMVADTKNKAISVNKNQAINEVTITKNEVFKNGISLMKSNKYREADSIFASMENKETMDNLAYLKLKRIQIAILEKDYKTSVSILEEIISGPQFSKQIKSTALENIFTAFLGSNRDPNYYEIIFSSPSLKHLKSDSVVKSTYNYAAFGYSFYPSTIFGANTFYKELANFKLLDKNTQDYKNEVIRLDTFNKEVLEFSNKEVDQLTKLPDQEVSLIIIHTERARLLNVISHQKDLHAPEGFSRERELVEAVKISQQINNDFYIFYSTFNYINFLISSGLTDTNIPENIKLTIKNNLIFTNQKNPIKEWYKTTVGERMWTDDEIKKIKGINEGLFTLIKNKDGL